MNSKNILIGIGVLGIGIILYKLLLGLVIPIALFVSLGYVLKFLLKSSDSELEQEGSQILSNVSTTNKIDNVVEIKPIEEEKSDLEEKPVEEEKSDLKEKPVEEEKSNLGDNPIDKINIG